MLDKASRFGIGSQLAFIGSKEVVYIRGRSKNKAVRLACSVADRVVLSTQ